MMLHMKHDAVCRCCFASPFRWRDQYRPSIFIADANFKAPTNGTTTSQAATKALEKKRETDAGYGYIKGVSRSKEKENERHRQHVHYKKHRQLRSA